MKRMQLRLSIVLLLIMLIATAVFIFIDFYYFNVQPVLLFFQAGCYALLFWMRGGGRALAAKITLVAAGFLIIYNVFPSAMLLDYNTVMLFIFAPMAIIFLLHAAGKIYNTYAAKRWMIVIYLLLLIPKAISYFQDYMLQFSLSPGLSLFGTVLVYLIGILSACAISAASWMSLIAFIMYQSFDPEFYYGFFTLNPFVALKKPRKSKKPIAAEPATANGEWVYDPNIHSRYKGKR